MLALPDRLYSPPVPLCGDDELGRRVKATLPADGPRVSPEAVLCYPTYDLQGDYVEPDGGDWTPFEQSGRLVNFEHGPYIGTGSLVMKSLTAAGKEPQDVPVGTTHFFSRSAELKGLSLKRYDAAGRHIGHYSADECLRTAEEVYPLVADGTLNGVSIEFRPGGPEGVAFKALGPSPLLDRPACHFWDWKGLGWAAACHLPVNPKAGYVVKSDTPLAYRAEKAFKLVHEGGIKFDPDGIIRKSLTPLAGLIQTTRVTARSATVNQDVTGTQHKGLFGGSSSKLAKKYPRKKGRAKLFGAALLGAGALAGGVAAYRHLNKPKAIAGGTGSMGTPSDRRGTFGQRKAFDPNDPNAQMQADPNAQQVDPNADPNAQPEHDGLKPGARVAYQGAQSCLDIADGLQQMMVDVENEDALADLRAEIAGLQQMAARLKATGDKVTARFANGDAPPEPVADEGDAADAKPDADASDDTDTDPTDAPPKKKKPGPDDLETDDDGAIKSKSFGGWKPARVTVTDRVRASDLGPPVGRRNKSGGPPPPPPGFVPEGDVEILLKRIDRLEAENKRLAATH